MKMFGMLFLSILLIPSFGAGQDTTTHTHFSFSEELVVTEGVTMWDLAETLYGDPLQWKPMFDVNVTTGLLDEEDLYYDETGRPIVRLAIGQNLMTDTTLVWPSAPPEITAAPTLPPPPPAREEDSSSSPAIPAGLKLLLGGGLLALAAGGVYVSKKRDLDAFEAVDGATPDFSDPILPAAIMVDEPVEEAIQIFFEPLPLPATTMTNNEVENLVMDPMVRTNDEGLDFIPGGVRNSASLGLAAQRAAQIDYVRRHPSRPVPYFKTIWVRNGLLGNITGGTLYRTFADGSRGPAKVATPEQPIQAWRISSIVEGEEIISYVEVICGNGMGKEVDGENIIFNVSEENPFGIPDEVGSTLTTVSVMENPFGLRVTRGSQVVSVPSWNGREPDFEEDGTMLVTAFGGIHRIPPDGEASFACWPH